jgi:hypothetical protein
MTIEAIANVKLTARDAEGNVFDEREVHNLVVNAGLEWIKEHAHDSADSTDIMKFTSVGDDDDPAPAVGQTILENQLGTRTSGTYASGATGVCTITGLHTATGSWAVIEAGLHDASTAGSMLARVIFSVINLSTDDELTVEWTITYS